MTGRRAVIGLSILCSLVFCAFAAPSAQALKGTTAFTCEPVATGGEATQGFSDEHCLTAATGKNVKFEHKEITLNAKTETTGTNEKVTEETKKSETATLKATLAGAELHITCEVVHSEGPLTNETPGTQMTVGGTGTIRFSKCTVHKPVGCKVTEPIIALANVMSQVVLKEGKEEMFVEFVGNGEKETFATLELKECAAAGKYPVRGKVIGTAKGATVEFKEKEPGNTLNIGGKEANAVGIGTFRMKEEGGKQQNPIVLTTTAN